MLQRTACGNNVRQIGLALYNFESARRKMPPFEHSISWVRSSACQRGDRAIRIHQDRDNGRPCFGSSTDINGVWAHSGNDIAVDGSNMTVVGGIPTASNISTTLGQTCAINCTNQGEIYAFHTGGAQVVLGDSSTQFLSATIDLRVLQLLCSRADGTPVSFE